MRRSFDHKKKKGFSLTEMLATIAIIVILIAIAIPSIISIRRSLEFKKMNNYAKEIFMAAQSSLVDRHVAGTLKEIRDKLDAENDRIPSLNNAQFPASEYSSEYYYITSGTTVSPAFDLVLPAGSIDPTLRDKKIMIEFNPYTGNVFSVFYSEGEEDLDYSNVTRVTSDRKKIMLGYYDGSGLSSDSAGNVVKQPTVELVSGQEAIVRITVPIPESYYDKPTTFRDNLDVSAVVKGEQYKGQFGINNDQFAAKQIVDGNKVVVDFCIDSLNNRMSFAGISQNNPAGTARNTAAISKPADLEGLKDLFVIQPGENVTIEATVSLNAPVGMETVTFNTVSVGGVNPMFESLQKINSGSARTYDLYISNGRQLQNLNAISPLIAKQVGNVYISQDIYWNETVTYYNNKYASGGTFNSTDAEKPARGLPYFVPISNEYLFGLASFSQGGTGSLPALSDTQDGDDLTADFNGGKNKILYLNINGSAVNIGKDYYAGNSEFGKDRFTGLFSYVDTMISGVYVVNPIVQGMSFTGVTGQPATGALVGAAGHNTFLYDCGVYIDKADTYYTTYGPLSNFKVTGYGAVGGLVGYAKSHRTTTGELSQDKAHLAFSQCFAAIPVTGNMRGNSDKCYGYTNGVGGIVGVSMLTNFYNCYASGAVNSTGAMASGSSPLRYSMGTGGFVGTSHGTKYSNCFATGDVWGTEAATGGFVGIVNYDEGFNYINSIYGTKRISQTTVFSSCYCCGVVNGSGGGKNDSGKGKFSGQFACANLRDANGNTMSDPAAHNYYDRWRDSDPYVYKDSYFLNMVSQKVNGNNNKPKPNKPDNSIADSCAELVAYSDLVDVPVFQSVQSIQKGDSRYQTGFLVADWEAATYQTTHPYSMDSGVYPFSKLTEMDYYGDWVSFTPSAGLAYYEYYDKNGNSIGYYFDRNDVTNDKKSGDLTLGNQTVYSDGYAIMINHDANANGWPIHEINLWVNGVKIPIGKNSTNMLLQLKGDNPTINGVKYHAYRIQPELMQIIVDATKEHPGEFYGEIVISMEFKFTGQQYFNMFFNPQFAMTQINSVFVSDQLQSPAVKPEGLPEKIGIRSPRQMRELAIDQRYWDKGYNFELETDLDMSLYNWSAYKITDTSVKPIGTEAHPFNGTFTGSSREVYVQNAYLKNYLTNLKPNTGDTAYAVFGQIGPDGRLSNLTVSDDTLKIPAGTVNAGLFAAVNEGTINEMHYTNPKATMDTKQGVPDYAGLVAAQNKGIIQSCELGISGTVSMSAKEAAGTLIGYSTGDGSAVTGNSISVGSVSFGQGKYTGGVFGILENSIYSLGTGDDKASPASVGSVSGKEITGGFAGKFSGTLESQEITIGNVSSGSVAAGFIGELSNATLDSLTLTMPAGTTVSGENGASAVAGNYTATNLNLIRVTIDGTVTSNSGNASGMLLEAQDDTSALSNCFVYLANSITAQSGNAAGFAGKTTGTVVNSHVLFTDPAAKITGKQAAGFVNLCTYPRNSALEILKQCDVTGAGTVSGTVQAAGFANTVDTNAQLVGVSTVRMDAADKEAAFLAGKLDDLKVQSANGTAALLANTVNAGQGFVSNCFAVGTVSGTNAAGFVNTNNGQMGNSMANVLLKSGSAFVGTNNGTVSGSYVWYSGTPSYSFVGENDGSASSSYAAALTETSVPFGPESGSYDKCYNVSENDGESSVNGVTNVSYEAMALVDDMGSAGLQWVEPDSRLKYPYSSELSDKAYPYPMLYYIPQYGDWVNPQDYAFGVFYYEKDADGNYTYHLVDLSEEAILKGGEYSDIIESVDHSVSEYGYGVFCHTVKQLGSIRFGNQLVTLEGKPVLETAPSNIPLSDDTVMKTQNYRFYVLSKDEQITGTDAALITVADPAGKVVHTMNPFFADAIDPQDGQTLHIHAAKQLQNIGAFPAGDFTVCHVLDMTGLSFRPIEELSGTLTFVDGTAVRNYNSGTMIQILSGSMSGAVFEDVICTDASLIGNLTGTVEDAVFTRYQGSDAIFGTVENGTVNNVRVVDAKVTSQAPVSAILANTLNNAQILNCTVSGDGEGSSELTVSHLVQFQTNADVDEQYTVGILAAESVNSCIQSCNVEGVKLSFTGEVSEFELAEGQSPEAVNPAAFAAVVGGAVGRQDADSVLDEVSVVGCSISTDVQKTQTTSATQPAKVEMTVGGIAGEQMGQMVFCTVSGEAPYDTIVDFGVHAEGTEITAYVGGLVGRMTDGTMDYCSIGDLTYLEDGTPDKKFVNLTVHDSSITEENPVNSSVTYYAGGIVGLDQGQTAPCQYNCCFGYAHLDGFHGENVGQFVGRANDGIFMSCSAWDDESELGFVGTVSVTEGEPIQDAYISSKFTEDTVQTEKNNGTYYNMERVDELIPQTVDAQFSNCYYADRTGSYMVTVDSRTVYTWERDEDTTESYSILNAVEPVFSGVTTPDFNALYTEEGEYLTEYYVSFDGSDVRYPVYVTVRMVDEAMVVTPYYLTGGVPVEMPSASIQYFTAAFPSLSDNFFLLTVTDSGLYALTNVDGELKAVPVTAENGSAIDETTLKSFLVRGNIENMKWYVDNGTMNGLQIGETGIALDGTAAGSGLTGTIGNGMVRYTLSSDGWYLMQNGGTLTVTTDADYAVQILLFRCTTSDVTPLTIGNFTKCAVTQTLTKVLSQVSDPFQVPALLSLDDLDSEDSTDEMELRIYPIMDETTGPVEEDPVVDAPVESEETEPTEPEETEPTEPVETEPTEPVETEPTEPVETEPTEPVETEPTEPVETEPTEPTEPESTEPEATLPPQTDDMEADLPAETPEDPSDGEEQE